MLPNTGYHDDDEDDYEDYDDGDDDDDDHNNPRVPSEVQFELI